MINPIIPLAISISEGRRTFAYFLGAGMSAAAGIPTGEAIFWQAVADVYTMIHNEPPTNDAELGAWFKASEFKDLNYSSILRQLRPTPEERRQYLEKFFIGKHPTAAHRAIAAQVKQGLVTVIVTTNFDRLMEKALDELGVSYDVVAASQDLGQVRPREHSPCRILKLHGDYQRLNLRNIERELERLDELLATEFQEILDRYGIIVIGYSGTDTDFRYHLEARRPRYGMYWVAKDEVSDWVADIIRQQDGRLVESDSADAFCSELDAKIGAFRAAPRGETPEMIIRQVEERLRVGDLIGLQHDIDRSARILRDVLYDANMNSWGIVHGERQILDELAVAMRPLCAVGYTLIKHRRWEELDYCLSALQVVVDVSKLRPQPYNKLTTTLPFLMAYVFVVQWAMYSVATRAFPALRRLLLRAWRVPSSRGADTRMLWGDPWTFQQVPILHNKPVGALEYALATVKEGRFLWDSLIVTDDDYSDLSVAVELLLAFLSVARNSQRRWFPTFAYHYDERQLSFLRQLRRDPEFAEGIATVFDETPLEFAERWDERANACATAKDFNLRGFLLWKDGDEK